MRKIFPNTWPMVLFVTFGIIPISAQETNYDESKVPPFQLPDVLEFENGQTVKTSATWPQRRHEILSLFEKHIYGKTPKKSIPVKYVVTEQGPAFNGKAHRKQVRIIFGKNESLKAHVLIYLPAQASRSVPVFLGLNFIGNQSVHRDPKISICNSWLRNRPQDGIENNQANDDSRGRKQGRWQVEQVIASGYGIVTCCCADFDPDKYHNGFSDGAHSLFYESVQTKPNADEWGSIGAWAWGLSRILDYLETDDQIDATKVALLGHSRLGKTALWAGAQDERFAIVISNNSGCGGAALFRRCFGERIHVMAQRFPDWFCRNYQNFSRRENDLPIDQHMLIALMAPRPVYVASAEQDRWADPKGEFLAAKYASPVFDLFGLDSLSKMQMPEPNQPYLTTVGYHMRTGKHDVTSFDWQQYLQFAERHFRPRP